MRKFVLSLLLVLLLFLVRIVANYHVCDIIYW